MDSNFVVYVVKKYTSLNEFTIRPDRLTGSHIVAHAAQTRIYLRKSKGERRIVMKICG
ncbi:MAG: hypothetical protein ACFFDP_07550 [Promethearchaeota archaeon]